MVRIGMLSMWHVHAPGYAKFVRQQPDARLTCVWDGDAGRGQAAAAEYGIDFVPGLDAFLARNDLDAVIVDAPTTDHYAVISKAAAARKHIFTEKVLAPTVRECARLSAEIQAAGVQFAICLFQLQSGAVQYVKKLIDDGTLGRVTNLRARNVHCGHEWLPERWYDMSKTAGGAMMDLGAHPNYIANYLLGKPKRITSVFNTVSCPEGVDDNTVALVEYENKAIAIIESGFLTPFSTNALEVEGTEGAVVVEGGRVRYQSRKAGAEGWIYPSRLPESQPPVMRQWLDAIAGGNPLPPQYGLDAAAGLTLLLENEYVSHREGRTVVL